MTKGILIFCLLCLLAIPIVLVTRGLDVDAIASYGYVGVFLSTFLASTTVIFPAPGFVVVVLAAAMFNPAWVAIAAWLGGSLGEFTSYLVGYGGRIAIGQGYSQRYNRAEDWMRRYGAVTIFIFALMPFLIFDLVGIAAGTLRYPYWKFLLATLAGHLPRTFVLAYLGWWILPRFFPFLQ
ncbi:MAG: YqaA family protein [Dehalococcoidia bacterium]